MVLQLVGSQEGFVAACVGAFVRQSTGVSANVCLEVARGAVRPTAPTVITFIAWSTHACLSTPSLVLTLHKNLFLWNTVLPFTTKHLTLFCHSVNVGMLEY